MSRLLATVHKTTLLAAYFAVTSSTRLSTSAATFVPHFAPVTIRRRLATSATTIMSKRVLVPIGDGSEEIETSCITDTLTRFGAAVTVASVMPQLLCKMSRGLQVQADTSIQEAVTQEWDLIVLPGGMPGAEHLRDCAPLIDLLKKQKAANKLFGAVCAAPAVVLASSGLIDDGTPATCFPVDKFRDLLPTVSDDKVVVSDNMTTSQGPGTALQFALQLGEHLYGKEKRDEIAKALLVP